MSVCAYVCVFVCVLERVGLRLDIYVNLLWRRVLGFT